MDIHVDIRLVLDIHVWIWYGFSDQKGKKEGEPRDAIRLKRSKQVNQ